MNDTPFSPYRITENQTQLLTMDVSMEQVEGECFKDWRETVYLKGGEKKTGNIQKNLGRYMSMIVKPETWLNVLGGKEGAFVRYIYIPLLKAAEAEEIAQELNDTPFSPYRITQEHR